MRKARPRLYAGFDGGGTRTTCVLCDPDGRVLGTGAGGRSNYHNRGVSNALASLERAFRGALERSGLGEDMPPLAACFGLAGLDSPKDMETMRSAIGSMRLGAAQKRDDLVVNDWLTAVSGAFIDEPGVTLIAGTGCVASAQSAHGREVVRVGGWGHVIDDRGSAYDIGRDALYAAMRDYDGRGPKTALLGLVMERLSVDEPQGIVARVYAEHMSVSGVASLSTLVGGAATAGDAVALKILEEKGNVLGALVVSAASRLGMLDERFGVSLNGGVFNAGRPILGPMEETIHAAAPLAEVVAPRLPPACGAIVLLLRSAGVDVDEGIVSRMRSSLQMTGQP